MKNASFYVLILSVFLLSASFATTQATPNTWMQKAPMPTARSGFGLVEVNGYLYAIGGFNKGQGDFSAANEVYNPETDTWTKKAGMPTHRVSFAMVAYEGRIYVFGGQILVAGHRVVINVSEAYDTATDSWATLTPMPHLGEDFAAYNVVGNKIYVVGNYTEVYDPAADSWETKATIPTLTAHSANAEVAGKIYVFSGNPWGNDPQNYQPINQTQIYDPQSDSWTTGAPIPVGVASAAAVATSSGDTSKIIYVIGGLTLDQDPHGNGYVYHAQNLMQVYYPSNNSWTNGTGMPTARYALAACVSSAGAIYAMGGSDARESPDSAANEQYVPISYQPPQSGLSSFLMIGAILVVVAVVGVVVRILFNRRRTKAA
jgi:N-acetylneuraminic acid mutarotase